MSARSVLDDKKFSNTKQIHQIAKWLVEEKEFKLSEEVPKVRWDELRYRLKKILGSKRQHLRGNFGYLFDPHVGGLTLVIRSEFTNMKMLRSFR